MPAILVAFVGVLLAVPAWAQTATVAVFPSTATNPNTSAPIAAPVSYTPICSQTPKGVEVLPISNPQTGAYDDPSNPARDCVVNIAPQMMALGVSSGYKAALRLGTAPYGEFSSAFSVAVQPVSHPCDSTPVSLITSVVGQVLTLGWCHSGLTTTGVATTITAWRIYRNGVLLALPVTVGTANAAGLRYYSATQAETVTGTASFAVAAVNAVGESARTPALGLTITQPATVPVVPIRTRIQ